MAKPTRANMQAQYDAVMDLQHQLWEEAAELEHMLGGVELDLNKDFEGYDLDNLPFDELWSNWKVSHE